ncbi:MAG: type II toxin-antitoxin system HicB family antitoxin [Dehalococcoidia bacterium]
MLTEYLDAAMRKAHYEMEDGEFFGEIPGLQGVLANGDSLEECREELRSVLEDWLLLGIALHHPLPEVDGLKLVLPELAMHDLATVPDVA